MIRPMNRPMTRPMTGPAHRLSRWFAALALTGLAAAAQAAIPIQHWTHASGARVFFVPSPALPMLDVQLDVDAGSRRDPVGRRGLAAVTAGQLDSGLLAADGAPALDENRLTEAWLDLGAQFGASASSDRFTVQLRTLTEPDLLTRAVALAARQLAHPAWAPQPWQRDRERLLAALREAENQPATLAGRRFAAAVYGDHPYGAQPSAADYQAISSEDQRDFYRRHVVACRAQVSLVGAIDRAEAERIADRLLAALAPHGCSPVATVPEVAPLAAAVDLRLPFARAAQAQVLIGQPGVSRSDPDFFPLFVGNYILGGGGFVSRLTTEVRERRGLSYSVYSYFSPGRHAGAFQIGLTTRPDQADQAVTVARDTLTRFMADGPTEAELAGAKAFLINGFALRFDSNRKLLDNVANIGWSGLPLDYLDTWTREIERVTAADIRRAFNRVLQPDRLVTVVVGAPQ